MATKNANPADLNWFKRAAKRHADELCFRAMGPWVSSAPNGMISRILTLPAGNWLWEKMFTDVFPHRKLVFTGIEQNDKVFAEMKKMGGRLSALSADHTFEAFQKPISFAEYMKFWKTFDGGKFDMIYLDWMGTWGKDKYAQIEQIFEQDMLTKDSLLRFTIGLNRGHPKAWADLNDVADDSFHIVDIRGGGGPLPKWKMHGIPALIETVGADYGRKVKMVTAHVYSSYHDGNRAAVPEVSFLFRVK